MLRARVVAVCLVLVALPARADTCAMVIDGAQMGPSPNFNEWRWTNACYISWPGGYVGQRNAREIYATKCKSLPGFLHFEGDYGSNRNTCIFSAPASGPQDEQAATDRPAAATKAASPDTRLPISYWRSHSPPATDLKVATDQLALGRKAFIERRYARAEMEFAMATSYISINDSDPNTVRLGEYAACMTQMPTLLDFTRKGIDVFANAQMFASECNRVKGEFLDDGKAELRAAYNESERKRHQALAAQAPVVPAPAGADSRCLVFRDPHDTGVGCAKGKSWLMTHIGVARDKSLACPDPVRFRYVDETGEQVADAPTTLQTCGDPPRNVRAGK